MHMSWNLLKLVWTFTKYWKLNYFINPAQSNNKFVPIENDAFVDELLVALIFIYAGIHPCRNSNEYLNKYWNNCQEISAQIFLYGATRAFFFFYFLL